MAPDNMDYLFSGLDEQPKPADIAAMKSHVKERLEKCPQFDSKEAALSAAVKRSKTNDAPVMVWQLGGKYLVCGATEWEIATKAGCEPSYAASYIYDLAHGRKPSEKANREELHGMMPHKPVKKAMTYSQVRKTK